MKVPPKGSSNLIRTAKAVATGLAGAVLIYVIAGLIGVLLTTAAVRDSQPRPYRIALLAGPIHYDLLIPMTPPVRDAFAFAQGVGVPIDAPQAKWLIVGWGAEGFYTTVTGTQDLTLPVIWRALTGDTSVMRLDVAGGITDPRGITFVDLSEGEFAGLIDAVLRGFARDTQGRPIPMYQPGFTLSDSFFVGTGRFNILRTCNVWVGDVLRAAGLPFGRWTPLPHSLDLSAKWAGIAVQ